LGKYKKMGMELEHGGKEVLMVVGLMKIKLNLV
jgi:hypothetical protein